LSACPKHASNPWKAEAIAPPFVFDSLQDVVGNQLIKCGNSGSVKRPMAGLGSEAFAMRETFGGISALRAPVMGWKGWSMGDPNGMYVLCCIDDTRWTEAPRLPSHGAFCLPDTYHDGVPHPGLTGLVSGAGSPLLADFQHGRDWLVVSVAAADAAIIDDIWGPISAVRFKRGFVVYRGDRRGALETLILLRADPSKMTVQLALPTHQGVAIAGEWGVAIGGRWGYAKSGDNGIALVGDYGVAQSGTSGEATVDGSYGLAVAGSGGSATTDFGGISIIRGSRGRACTGDQGVAVGLRDVEQLQTQQRGVAVAQGQAGFVQTGDDSVVVVGAADTKSGPQFRVGNRSLVVCRGIGGGASGVSFAIGVAGLRGFEANGTYQLCDGQFRPCALMASTFVRASVTAPHEEFALATLEPSSECTLGAGEPWWTYARTASPEASVAEVLPSPTAIVVLQRRRGTRLGQLQ
jgi:hypothetical protein